MAEPTKPTDINEGSLGAPVAEGSRDWSGVAKNARIAIAILVVCGLIYLFMSFIHWLFPQPGTSRWSGSYSSSGNQPAATETREKVEPESIPVGAEFGEDLYRNVKVGERIAFNPIGARMVFYCIAGDKTYTFTNGPIGTAWFTPINADATMVYAKLADPQPEGLVPMAHPYVEIKKTRSVTTTVVQR